jgi:uncharacterized protein
MADTRFNTQSGTQVQIDQGLRSYMLGVYNYMALGVALSGAVIMAVTANPAVYATISSLNLIFFFALLGLSFFAQRLIYSGNTAVAHMTYWSYCVLMALMITPMVGHYLRVDSSLVFRAFLVSSITFGATSLAGYVTKRDLSGWGGFLFMAVIGVIVAMIVNLIFFQSTIFSLLTSVVVVLLFSAITAYRTQMIKEWYVDGDVASMVAGKSILGALFLYSSFVTLFVHILNIMGIMRSN